jgi:dGTP triphosphohydrolase
MLALAQQQAAPAGAGAAAGSRRLRPADPILLPPAVGTQPWHEGITLLALEDLESCARKAELLRSWGAGDKARHDAERARLEQQARSQTEIIALSRTELDRQGRVIANLEGQMKMLEEAVTRLVAVADRSNETMREIDARHPGLEPGRFVHELGRRLITRFVEDAIREGAGRLAAAAPESAHEVRAQDRPMVTFSDAMQAADKAIKGFLYPHMYRHPKVMKVRIEAAEVVRRIARAFLADPALMPGEWALAAQAASSDEMRVARLICDYIAGMTDRFALAEHRRLFGEAPELR